MKNMSEIEEQCRTYCNHLPKFNINSESIKKLGEKLKKTRVEATKFYGGDSEEPYLTLEREVEEEPVEEEPMDPSWLEEIISGCDGELTTEVDINGVPTGLVITNQEIIEHDGRGGNMSKPYWHCEACGGNFDFGERCDCESSSEPTDEDLSNLSGYTFPKYRNPINLNDFEYEIQNILTSHFGPQYPLYFHKDGKKYKLVFDETERMVQEVCE